ncbi:salicylyl-CoA 5-hydroxylase [Mycobacteroides abscessus subsp. abscessus]|nr:salicylyl-CoA 5-hydroxylase [Mycobacteroides abscessus subsp. abscessus]
MPHGVAVVAVGAISSHDDVNSVLLAGRADLVAIGRAHLWDPQWTLHAAVEQGYRGEAAEWPAPFRAGNRKPPTGRTDGPPPRLELIRCPGATLPGTWSFRGRRRTGHRADEGAPGQQAAAVCAAPSVANRSVCEGDSPKRSR